MIELLAYDIILSKEWDDIVRSAPKGHFMFQRAYMNYHQDRFQDASLMFKKKGRVVAVFPANISDNILYSHQGLSFGGIIHGAELSVQDVESVLELIIYNAKERGLRTIVYKCIPEFYHSTSSSEDLYALFRKAFTLYRRDVSSLIDLKNPVPFAKDRRYRTNKSKRNDLTAAFSPDIHAYMKIVTVNLEEKFGVSPTHSADEMALLNARFPYNIRLKVVKKDDIILAGAILYIHGQVVHIQYLHSSENGKKLNAMEFLIDDLVSMYRESHRWLDFGISTENEGMKLNGGLIDFKQGFGARAQVHDFYRLEF